MIMGSFTRIDMEHPLDYCFDALNIRMKDIEKTHPEYKMVMQYISISGSSSQLKRVFAVERRGKR